MLADDAPFLLFDDARAQGAARARLYRGPVEIVRADAAGEVAAALDRLAAAQGRGLHVAGYASYELGFALEDRLAGLMPDDCPAPLLWFGLFRDYVEITPDEVTAMLPDPAGGWLGPLEPQVQQADYRQAFDQVQAHIRAGDIYQANLTFPARIGGAGHPLAIYAALRARAGAGYGGVAFDGENWMLSCSPELFFTLRDGRITARPMKGTATRDSDPALLASDPKQRAENLMIVDLLRNDLSRVARPGSVQVPELFHVETYPTVHQMTSTVQAELADGCGPVDLLRAIFPCGSITGAPKIRAMELIDEIEAAPRGAYCGSFGRIDANGDAAFNVAIRTLWKGADDKGLTLGLGSGIVADSVAGAEWEECLAKGAFTKLGQVRSRQIGLIETMHFAPDKGIVRIEAHLERMKASAAALGFSFDRHEARNAIHAATFHCETDAKVRLLACRNGSIAIELGALPPARTGPVPCRIVPQRADAQDFRLHHKTTDRRVYAADGLPDGFEPVFIDGAGRVTEARNFSVFVERDGQLVTPPLTRGLLPGVLRAELIASGEAVEADLSAADLADGFLLGNAVRGLIRATLAE